VLSLPALFLCGAPAPPADVYLRSRLPHKPLDRRKQHRRHKMLAAASNVGSLSACVPLLAASAPALLRAIGQSRSLTNLFGSGSER